jgi:FKBP-type peptidyl-prolyl cis-trans isomerase
MASVFIDIPGIGNVEAKNAATESTLRELVGIMKGIKKNTGGGGAGGGGGGGTTTDAPGGPTSALGKAANMTGKALGTMAKTAGTVIGGFDVLSKVTTGIIQSFANVGDSVESAAGIFKGIPIVGTVFGAVASAATKVTKAYTDSSAAGATFGGSMQEFSRAASTAGMTMENFSRMIAQNGEALTAFGATTEAGANRFATVSKELRAASSGLYALGYTTEEINQGLANYGKTIKMQGRQSTMTNAELVAGSKKYLQEMDLLAKVTGETRKQQEDARAKLLMDAQVQSKISNMTKEDGEAFMNTINGLPPGLRDVAKDIMVTGTATTEESQRFSSMMPRSAEMMRKFAQITDSGGRVTAEMQQELQNLMAQEGKQKQAEMRSVGMYNKEFAGTMMQVNNAAAMNKDALTDAEKAQLKAQEETDAMNKRIQEAQQTLAKFSNQFQMALVNSGLLDTLMQTFGIVAGIVQTVVVPAFDVIGKLITNVVFPVFRELAAFFVAYVIPGVKQAIDTLLPIFQAVGETLLPPLQAVGKFIFENLTPLLVGLGSVFLAYKTIVIGQNILEAIRTGTLAASIAGFLGLNVAMLPFVAIAAAVVVGLTAMWYIFKKLGGDTEVLSDGFKWLWSYLEEFGQNLVLLYYKIMDKITVGSEYKDKAKEQEDKIKATQEERLATEKRMSDRMAANRAAIDAKDKKYEDTKNALDLKKLDTQKKGTESLESANKKQAEEQEKKLNLNANENDLLVDFAKQQDSAYIKDKPALGSMIAETSKVNMLADAQATKEGAIKKAEEEQKKAEEAKKANSTTAGSGTATQESPASLLASLNTKMDQLISVNRRVFEVAENQLSVQKGLSGNLYKSI